MVHHYKEHHQETDEERDVSRHFSYGGSVLRGNGEVDSFFEERKLVRYVFQGVIEIDLLVYLVLEV